MSLPVVKDSGKREEYSTGMVRDTQDGKPMYNLVNRVGIPLDKQMLTRWAALMTAGAKKYGFRNWERACTQEEIDRFKESAFRHMMQWLAGEADEDHAAAVMFNINACETTKHAMTLLAEKKITGGYEILSKQPLTMKAKGSDANPPNVTYPMNASTNNERDVKMKAHGPEDHGPEFWTSNCIEPECVADRHRSNEYWKKDKHYDCLCPLSMPGRPTW